MAGQQRHLTGLPLYGRALRFVLVEQLEQHRRMTVAEMVSMITEHRFVLTGRASKVISDALRWEVARGRVVRLGRGLYAYGRPPRTTARRIRRFGRQCRAWMTAVLQGRLPPQTPPTPEHRKVGERYLPVEPYRPPWQTLNWLWDT